MDSASLGSRVKPNNLVDFALCILALEVDLCPAFNLPSFGREDGQ